MAAALTRVVSVDEFIRKDEAIAAGVTEDYVEKVRKLEARVRQLEGENRALKERVEQRGKITPGEVRQNINKILEERGWEPLLELMEMAFDKNEDGTFKLSTDQRIRILTEATQYRIPKLKSVEHSGEVDHHFHIHFKRFGELGEREVIKEIRIGDGRVLDMPSDGESALPEKGMTESSREVEQP